MTYDQWKTGRADTKLIADYDEYDDQEGREMTEMNDGLWAAIEEYAACLDGWCRCKPGQCKLADRESAEEPNT